MRLLTVVPRYPWPPRRGDQMRAVEACELLSGEHDVTLLAPAPVGNDPPPPGDLPYRLETYTVRRSARAWGVVRSALTGRPLQAGLFHQPDLGRRLRELAPGADLVLLQLVRLASHAGDLGDTPFIVDLIDSLALNFQRRARYDRPWTRPLLRLEARRLLRWEERLLRRAAAGYLVCDRDRTWLADRLPPDVARKLHTVPLWLPRADDEHRTGPLRGPEPPRSPEEAAQRPSPPPRSPEEAAQRPSRRARSEPPRSPTLTFTGNLGYFPNADAITHFTRTVWPALHTAHPGLTLTIAGARPPAAVRRLQRLPGVRFHPNPPDLASILAHATAAIAPLRAGSGVPVKVLEAWAAGVPVVASPWAAAGAAAHPGRELLVAETPAEWQAAVTRLLTEPALRQRLITAGRNHLTANHGREAVRRKLLRVVEAVR